MKYHKYIRITAEVDLTLDESIAREKSLPSPGERKYSFGLKELIEIKTRTKHFEVSLVFVQKRLTLTLIENSSI